MSLVGNKLIVQVVAVLALAAMAIIAAPAAHPSSSQNNKNKQVQGVEEEPERDLSIQWGDYYRIPSSSAVQTFNYQPRQVFPTGSQQRAFYASRFPQYSQGVVGDEVYGFGPMESLGRVEKKWSRLEPSIRFY